MAADNNTPTNASKSASVRTIGVFVLAMINVAAVLSLRNLPAMAEYGWSSIFWTGLGTVLFLLPLSLVGAELASGWPNSSGVYDWVRLGFGKKPGFVAIWSEWVENVVWFPSVLSFLAATLAYVINPDLANNRIYLVVIMLGTFWLITGINCMGDRWSGTVSSVGTILGTVIPAVVLISLAIYWMVSGRGIAIPWEGPGSLLPSSFNLSSLALVSTVILMFAGMEMAGYHARETKNPQRDFPRAMFISAAVVFLLTTLGTLAIAFVIPAKDIGLASGLMQAFQEFFKQLGMEWAVAPMGLLVFIGGFALVSTWVIGPAKGMRGPGDDGLLPPMWTRENKHGVPVGVIILQAVIGSLFAFLFVLVPSVNSAYWILSALTTLIISIMYILIFTSVIRLRYTHPDHPRPFKIPGGKMGIWIVAGLGLLAAAFALVVGFFPPSQIITMSTSLYVLGLLAGVVILSLPPFIFYFVKKPSWLEAAQKSASEGIAAGTEGES
ncbi:MAG: amino acid permease [Ardenticatenia bacterium]|nr:amino acid permease [Ardenticatenia bacterium]